MLQFNTIDGSLVAPKEPLSDSTKEEGKNLLGEVYLKTTIVILRRTEV